MGGQLTVLLKNLRTGLLIVATAALVGCSWVDETGKQTNENPEILLDQTFLSYEEGDTVRVSVADDDPISTRFELIDSGPAVAGACGSFFTPIESAETLEAACVDYLSDGQCAIEFTATEEDDKVYTATIPALTQSLAQRYLVHVEDRTGAFDEREVDLCLVAVNTEPVPEDDSYQVVYRDTLSTADQTYNEQCQRISGDGVLRNDNDDFDANSASASGPACLRAELVNEPYPGFELRAGGGFDFTSDGSVAPGGTHTFEYRASDGELSALATVSILVTGENNRPTIEDTIEVLGTENTPADIDVLSFANDSETPDQLSIRSLTEPSNGSAVQTSNGEQVRYTPAQNFFGEDRFDVTIADPAGSTATATVIVTVREINDPPLVDVPSSQSIVGTGNITVTATVSDSETTDPRALNTSITSSNAAVATATVGNAIGGDGSVSITIVPLSNGSTTLTLSVTDQPLGNGFPAETTSASFTVRVTGINTEPTANNDAMTLASGATQSLNISANDSDPDGDALRFSIVSSDGLDANIGATSGVLTVTAPATNSNLSRSIVYEVSDGRGGTDRATVAVTVTAAANQPPVAANDSITLASSASGNLNVSTNDNDPDGANSAMTYVLTDDGGLNANLTSAGVLSVTAPATTTNQSYTLSYRVTDARAGTDTATVTVNVTAAANQPPVAANDSITLASGASDNLNVSTNDNDPDGANSAMTYVLTNNGGLTTASLTPSGVLSVTAPATTTNQSNTLSYRVTDARGGTDTATVTVNVTASPNQPPVAANDSITLASSASGNLNVRTNDNDPDGANSAMTYVLTDNGGLTTASLTPAGVLSVTAPATTTNQSFTLSYRVTDARGGTDTATVTVNVTAAPNQPPVAANDSITLASGASGNLNVRTNDNDPDGANSALTYVLTDNGGLTTASLTTGGVLSATAPATTTNQSFTLSYRVTDARGGTDTATVTVNVTAAANQPPVAANDSITLASSASGNLNVSVNDNDPDGSNGSMTYVLTDNGSLTTASLTPAGLLSVTAPATTTNQSYTLSYRVTDVRGGTDTATVTVNVTAAPNQPPVAANDSITLASGASGNLNVSANDNDPDGANGAMTYVLTDNGGLTTASLTPAGLLSVTAPATAIDQSYTLSYRVTDARGGTDTATVTSNVSAATI